MPEFVKNPRVPHEHIHRVAIVTGAAGDIGAAIARRLIAADMLVFAADSDLRPLTELARCHPGKVRAYEANLSTPKQAAMMVRAAVAWAGRLDVLVNNGLPEQSGTAAATIALQAMRANRHAAGGVLLKVPDPEAGTEPSVYATPQIRAITVDTAGLTPEKIAARVSYEISGGIQPLE